jgi:hypothetical protein
VKVLRAPYIVPKQLACGMELREYIEAHELSNSLSEASSVCEDKAEVRRRAKVFVCTIDI